MFTHLLKELSHTVLLFEHDPTLFNGAEEMMPQIAGILKDISRESLVISYTPSITPLSRLEQCVIFFEEPL
jgi:hypothetical protein